MTTGMNGRIWALVCKVAGVAGLVLCAMALPRGAGAQDLFAPRLYIGDQVITEYEVFQRALFLQVLRAPGNPEDEALKALTEDKLRLAEAKRLGLKVTDEDVLAGMEEFASRASLTADQLVEELAKVGIAAETYRDFVVAGLLWRQAVRARFLGQVTASDADIDKAITAATRPRGLRVLVSELVIVAEPGREEEALALATRLSQEIDSEGAFASAARRYSASPTAGRGGRLDWMPLSNLPPAIAGQVIGLGEGDVSAPVSVPGAVVLFQLNGIAQDESAEPVGVTVEWAELLVDNDVATIAAVTAAADVCLDLYGLARGLPEDRLTITTAALSDVPGDVGLDLARLDPGEIADGGVRSGYRRLVMLCSRTPIAETPPVREEVREIIINQKLEGLADGYLEELRAAAIIRTP